MLVLLDTGPLSAVTNPRNNRETAPVVTWLQEIMRAGHEVAVPEIADYELRRNLILEAMTDRLRLLDELIAKVSYVPLTTATMRKAAALWADARKRRKQFAADKALDGDVILIAQAQLHPLYGSLVVATTDVGHLGLYVNAKLWSEIHP